MVRMWICCGLSLLCQPSTERPIPATERATPATERTAPAQERMRVAPASGGAEIEEIDIKRRIALGAVKEADLTNMNLSLWFPADDWEQEDRLSPPLIHMLSLEPIVDDTGYILTSQKRLEDIDYLLGEVRGTTWKVASGKNGPVIDMRLEAPKRGANQIKAIKGEAKVTLTRMVTLTFPDLAAIKGQVLDHPELKDLKEMNIQFEVTEEDGDVTATLSAPFNFASPWNRGRIHDWELFAGKQRLSAGIFGKGPADEGAGGFEKKTYRRRTLKGLSLRLVVLEPIKSKTFQFDFQNVDLP